MGDATARGRDQQPGPGDEGGGEAGSGMSDSGSPRRPRAAGAPSNNADAAGGGGGGQRDGGSGGEDGVDERVLRRRAINRNSQKRIRERRHREMDELREEVRRLTMVA
jgi:hypothetical protein